MSTNELVQYGDLHRNARAELLATLQQQEAVYTIRVYCADEQEPFRAEVDEHPALTAFGRELGEVLENVAKGISSLE